MLFNRRCFLKLSLAGGVTAASAHTLPSSDPATAPRPEPRLKCGFFTEDQYTDWFNEVDPAAVVRAARANGARMFGVNFYEAYRGRFYHASRLYPELRLLPERDLLGEYARAARDNQLEFWVWCVERGAPRDSILAERFRDATVVDREGQPTPSWGDPNVVAFCPNSPWRDFMADIYREVAANYEVAGFLVSDEPGQFQNACYCRYCRERFAREQGADPPRVPDWDNESSLWWSFVRARTSWWADYFNHLARAVKDTRPRTRTAIALSPGWVAENHLWYGVDMWRAMTTPALDYFAADLWRTTEHPAWHTFAVDLSRALARRTRGKDAFPYIGGQTTNAPDLKSALYCGALSGADTIFCSPIHAVLDYPDNLQAAGEAFSKLASIPELVGSEPIPYAALWISQWDWDRVDHLPESHFHGAYGAHHSLTWSSLPLRLLPVGNEEVPDLSSCRLVVLASVARLSRSQLEALRRFVSGGGGLLVVGAPAAMEGEDSTRDLEELLGARLSQETKPAYRLQVEAEAARSLALRPDLLERSLIRWPYRPFERAGLEPLGGARVCAMYLSLAREATSPAAVWVEHPSGGRTVYFRDPLFEVIPAWLARQRGNKHHSQGFAEGYRYARLLGAFAAWASGGNPPLKLEARDNIYASGRTFMGGYLLALVNCNHDRGSEVRLNASLHTNRRPVEVTSSLKRFARQVEVGGENVELAVSGWLPAGELEWVVVKYRVKNPK